MAMLVSSIKRTAILNGLSFRPRLDPLSLPLATSKSNPRYSF